MLSHLHQRWHSTLHHGTTSLFQENVRILIKLPKKQTKKPLQTASEAASLSCWTHMTSRCVAPAFSPPYVRCLGACGCSQRPTWNGKSIWQSDLQHAPALTEVRGCVSMSHAVGRWRSTDGPWTWMDPTSPGNLLRLTWHSPRELSN